MILSDFFAENPSAALGFSGGVDSSYLLYAGLKAGANIGAYYVDTAFQPRFQLLDAMRLTDELGIPLVVIEADIFSLPEVTANPADRCCFCKRALFSQIMARATEDGFGLVIDGTNASDSYEDRPGMRALRELGVRSPLRECGMTKAEIRRLSKEAGLFTWDNPAYSCLATRIPAGTPITREALDKVERAENALREMGFSDLRVRVRGENAVLQLKAAQFAPAIEKREEITGQLLRDFGSVLLDLEGRL
ncbi:MAG: ATP-dependent sacrificial sulfur transferase LarE [Clostridia bacterium]|nr:ATP-dependent sacrificial sulfur transferase LarE [Clostridia bacterium]